MWFEIRWKRRVLDHLIGPSWLCPLHIVQLYRHNKKMELQSHQLNNIIIQALIYQRCIIRSLSSIYSSKSNCPEVNKLKNKISIKRRLIVCVLYFNNKMQKPIGPDFAQTVLSPKETQHHRFRTSTLQRIDSQIEKIMSLNSLQNQQYKESIEKITLIQNIYQRENKELKESLSILKEQHESMEKMYLSLKEQFQNNLLTCQDLQTQNNSLKKEVEKLKVMVRNQENLIDQYRKNIEQEIALQKQLIKSQCEQEKAKMSKAFNRALQQLEKQYQEKFRKIQKQQKIREYKNQMNEGKQYVVSREPSKKNLIQKNLKPSNSQYSTLDQESRAKDQQTKWIKQKGHYDQQNRHNQPVFLV